ncbi:MAG: TIM barrel protein [Bacteroidales bacterium]|nr:TIM barrel protein [Bacteroidales bacterium]
MNKSRRKFIKDIAITSVAIGIAPSVIKASQSEEKEMFFKISLAQWSLHRKLFDKGMSNLEFPEYTKTRFDIHALEYVSVFFESTEMEYLKELKMRTDDLNLRNVLIMVDAEGNLGDADEAKRIQSVENHHKWIEAAKFLGCHSIRVNARGRGTAEEVAVAAVDGLGRLTEYGAKENINVIVENHGGYSSNGEWLSGVIKKVNHPNCGTLPDFGNFRISREEEYDRYKGVEELMPFAKGVSAKSRDFDENGNEIHTDYFKMLKIVKEAGYTGYIGVEYEGGKLSEDEGIIATKQLLEKVGKEIS